MEKIKYLLNDYWDDILTIQIPYHDSHGNYHVVFTGFRYSHSSKK